MKTLRSEDPKTIATATSLQRNRISMRHVLHAQFAATQSVNAYYKWVRELLELDILRSHKVQLVPEAKTYLTLGERGCDLTGAKRRFAEPVPEQELGYELGCLAYTSMRKPYKKRLLTSELKSRYPFLSEKHFRWAWLTEFFTKKPVLTTIRVEHRASIDSVVGKVAHQLESYREEQDFAELLDRGGLMISIIVATKEKAIGLERTFRSHPGYLTPRMNGAWESGKAEHVRINPVFYPPLLRLEG